VDEWNFFGFLYNNFAVQFLAAVQANAGNLASALQTPLLLGVTIWLAATSAMELLQPGTDPMLMFVRKAIRAMLVIGLVTAANYTQVFCNFVITTLPNELTAAISGAKMAGTLTPHAFDALFQSGWVGVLGIVKNVSVWEPKTVILALFASLSFLVGAFFIAIGFLIFIACQILLGLAITVGPAFVCLLLWEKTVSYFTAWISVLAAGVMTQVLVVALLAVLMTTEQNIMQQISAMNAASGGNANDIGGQVHYLIESALLYFMIGYLAPKVVELAQSMTGGATPGISALSQMAHSALSKGAGNVASAAGSGIKAAGAATGRAAAAGMRSIKPAGRAPS
jgi:type IV secretion system protein VirB6